MTPEPGRLVSTHHSEMEPRAQFEQLVKVGLAPVLEAQGFSRRNETFHKRVGRNWTSVNLQKSTETTAEQVIFYVNLGISSHC